MKKYITAIMCMSFVNGLYEAVVDCYFHQNIWYTGGGFCGTKWTKDNELSYNSIMSEEQVRSLISDEQWHELLDNDIIECNIQI